MISIIIPLYNKETSILGTVNSIINQNYNNYEIVIVNDGSTDNSISIIKSIQCNRIVLLDKPNGGPASARNFGVKHAHGNWIIFLDADDYLEPNALQIFAEMSKKHPKCHFFCGNHYICRRGHKLSLIHI